jgi:hypothetical protein
VKAKADLHISEALEEGEPPNTQISSGEGRRLAGWRHLRKYE